MRKKFLYIVSLALLASAMSLFVNRLVLLGDPIHQGGYSAHGFPFPVYKADFYSIYFIIAGPFGVLGTVLSFFANVFVYFLLFSSIYFVYSKFFRNATKK